MRGGGGGIGMPFARAPVDDLVMSLAIECPSVTFRDAVDPAQAGEHVLYLTAAIAKAPHRETVRQRAAGGRGGGETRGGAGRGIFLSLGRGHASQREALTQREAAKHRSRLRAKDEMR